MEQVFSDHVLVVITQKNTEPRINQLIKDIKRDPIGRIVKPESLKYSIAGYWSRRINDEHRLVYKV